MLHGGNIRDVTPSGLDQTLQRRDAILLTILAAMGLATSGVFPRGVDAAKRDKKQDQKQGKKRAKKKKSKKGKESKDKQGGSSSGSEVVRVAQKYKGASYTSGGASPQGFDCSGFTWYVYDKAAGMDITRGVEEQWRQGRSVGRGDWQPGDLVFFENTSERGLSHVGIFVKGTDFIHAENEQTGVVESSLDSDYYSKHYAGARRLL